MQSNKPEDRSDRLDINIAEYARKDYQRRKLINILLGFLVVLNLLTLAIMGFLAVDTHKAVTAQIPGLKKQITDRDKTISNATYIITKQAVPELLYMNEQIKKLGGTPPLIILTETKPPFTPPQ